MKKLIEFIKLKKKLFIVGIIAVVVIVPTSIFIATNNGKDNKSTSGADKKTSSTKEDIKELENNHDSIKFIVMDPVKTIDEKVLLWDSYSIGVNKYTGSPFDLGLYSGWADSINNSILEYSLRGKGYNCDSYLSDEDKKLLSIDLQEYHDSMFNFKVDVHSNKDENNLAHFNDLKFPDLRNAWKNVTKCLYEAYAKEIEGYDNKEQLIIPEEVIGIGSFDYYEYKQASFQEELAFIKEMIYYVKDNSTDKYDNYKWFRNLDENKYYIYCYLYPIYINENFTGFTIQVDYATKETDYETIKAEDAEKREKYYNSYLNELGLPNSIVKEDNYVLNQGMGVDSLFSAITGKVMLKKNLATLEETDYYAIAKEKGFDAVKNME